MAESSESMSGPSGESQTTDLFATWVHEHGGDSQFLAILTEHGFTSKLSLGNLDVSALEATGLLDQLNYGQKCLLRGLVRLCRTESGSSSKDGDYGKVIEKVKSIRTKGKKSSIRSKLGQLFRFDPVSTSANVEESGSDSDDFQPVALKHPPSSKKRKTTACPPSRKGKHPAPAKRKVKEYRLKVVVLPLTATRIPPPSKKEVYEVWICATANEEEVMGKIQTVLGWGKEVKLQYLYAQGRNIRPATLNDIEGADTWDFDTVRALMGNGCLYISKVTEVRIL